MGFRRDGRGRRSEKERSRNGLLSRLQRVSRQVQIVLQVQIVSSENGGRYELRLEPSGKIKPILSRLFSGMVLDKRIVQIAIDLRNGRNPRERQVGASIYA